MGRWSGWGGWVGGFGGGVDSGELVGFFGAGWIPDRPFPDSGPLLVAFMVFIGGRMAGGGGWPGIIGLAF